MARGTYRGSELVDQIRRTTTALEMALMPEDGQVTPEAAQTAWDTANELTRLVGSVPAIIADIHLPTTD